ncbi:MAG: NADH:ubiquinone reductase (Na(+)-transporting) subunit A, partial [Deltaproteobacteria bacterium]
MKNGKLRSVLSLILLVCGPSVFAQAGSSDNNSFVTILIAVVVLLAFFALIQVSDNLLKLEARQLGVADKIGEVSLLPTWRDLFRSKVPAYAKNHTLLEIKRGADLPIAGEARKEVRDAKVTRFAVQPPNWRGLAPIPRLLVQVGDPVKAGDPLFEDKKHPEMKFVAPVSGEVIAINRGAKRAITEVVILADKDQQHREVTA